MKSINIGFVCEENPFDRKPQSGTTFQTFRALGRQEGLNVFWIPFPETFWSRLWLKLQRKISWKLQISLPLSRSSLYIKMREHAIDKHLLKKADVLFCPFTQLISVKKPIVYMSDAVYHSMVNYYWPLDPKSRQVRIGDKTQQKVLDHTTKIVLSSQWAVNDTLGFYHQPKEKVVLAELGANIDEEDITPHEYHYNGHLHVLFLGVDWERKGGAKAVDTCQWLNENGVKTTLHIVGISQLDESIKNLDYVDYVGFLDKNNRCQYNKLKDIISKCHCMLLPTRAECAGIAFCESSACGLPSFSYHTGGIPNYVMNGKNGYLLPLSASGEDFGRKIKECLESGDLERMSQTCLNVYRSTLNWNVWGEKTAKVLKSIVQNE